MKRTTLKKIYMVVITALLLVAVAVSVACLCFGWFAENKAVTANGLVASVNADKGMEFTDTVTATHYTVSGDVITYTYKKDSTGNLTLTTKETVNSDKTEKTVVNLAATTPTITLYTLTDSGTSWSDGTSYEYSYNETDGTYTYTVTNEDKTTETVTVYEKYLIDNILPGEYIDVTIGFYLTDSSLQSKGYTITLGDFASEEENTFNLNVNTTTTENGTTSTSSSTKQCGVLPAFKWGIPSEENGNDTTTYTFFHGKYDSSNNTNGGFFYYINGGDDSTYTETIEKNGTWDDSNLSTNGDGTDCTSVSFTFRIMEDFTEYYKLFDYTVSGGTAEYDNYLSNKIMNIGQIRLEAKEDSST